MKKHVQNQTPPFDVFLKFKPTEKEVRDEAANISPGRRLAAQDLSTPERADGSWAVVPLPAYFERLYRRERA
jgi:hypothetical protein